MTEISKKDKWLNHQISHARKSVAETASNISILHDESSDNDQRKFYREIITTMENLGMYLESQEKGH